MSVLKYHNGYLWQNINKVAQNTLVMHQIYLNYMCTLYIFQIICFASNNSLLASGSKLIIGNLHQQQPTLTSDSFVQNKLKALLIYQKIKEDQL